jgi:CheY-like chemotaxis protein
MKKNTILIVEDDELDVISVQRTLSKFDMNCELLTAYNGKEALAMLQKADAVKPDLVLLDINMPKMNGIEFLKAVRANEQLKDLRIFIMTTSADSADLQATQQLGISGYMIKPLNYTDNSKRSDAMDAFVEFHLRKILNESIN